MILGSAHRCPHYRCRQHRTILDLLLRYLLNLLLVALSVDAVFAVVLVVVPGVVVAVVLRDVEPVELREQAGNS